MLSNKKIICPNNLIKVAKMVGKVDAAIVNAGEIFPMESVYKAVEHNLINPIFIGDKNKIREFSEKLKWDISKFKIIDEKNENNTAPVAAKLASEDKVRIIVKGHIHTDILMKAVLKRDLNLIGKKRLSHVWHMTLDKSDVIVNDEYIGPGYGEPTDQMKEATKLLAQKEAILLDPVYTGKGFAGLIGLIKNKRFNKNDNVLFIHTGGAVSLSAYEWAF